MLESLGVRKVLTLDSRRSIMVPAKSSLLFESIATATLACDWVLKNTVGSQKVCIVAQGHLNVEYAQEVRSMCQMAGNEADFVMIIHD